jgi:hypothetical protein
VSFAAGTSLLTFLTWLRHQRFTGTITLHVQGGLPRSATWGAPSKVVFEVPPRPEPQPPSPPGLDKLSENRPHSVSEERPSPKRP